MTGRHLRPVQLGDGLCYIGEYLLAGVKANARLHRIRSRTSQVAKMAVTEAMNLVAFQSNPFMWAQLEG